MGTAGNDAIARLKRAPHKKAIARIMEHLYITTDYFKPAGIGFS